METEHRTPPVADGRTTRHAAPFVDLEIRAAGDGKMRFRGLAAVFDSMSEDLGGYYELIKRGFFKDVLEDDVRFLAMNHDANLVCARTTAGNMKLAETPKGLEVDAELSETQASRDLKTNVDDGNVTQMSFGFNLRSEGRTWSYPDGIDLPLRILTRCNRLFDVSPVTFPAYTETEAEMRTLTACGVVIVRDGEVLADDARSLAWRVHRGEQTATTEERAAIEAALSKLDTVTPWIAERTLRACALEPELLAAIPGQRATVHIEDAPAGLTTEGSVALAARRRRLDLLALEQA